MIVRYFITVLVIFSLSSFGIAIAMEAKDRREMKNRLNQHKQEMIHDDVQHVQRKQHSPSPPPPSPKQETVRIDTKSLRNFKVSITMKEYIELKTNKVAIAIEDKQCQIDELQLMVDDLIKISEKHADNYGFVKAVNILMGGGGGTVIAGIILSWMNNRRKKKPDVQNGSESQPL